MQSWRCYLRLCWQFFLKWYFYVQQNQTSWLHQDHEIKKNLRKDNYFNSCPQGKSQMRVKFSQISNYINLEDCSTAGFKFHFQKCLTLPKMNGRDCSYLCFWPLLLQLWKSDPHWNASLTQPFCVLVPAVRICPRPPGEHWRKMAPSWWYAPMNLGSFSCLRRL